MGSITYGPHMDVGPYGSYHDKVPKRSSLIFEVLLRFRRGPFLQKSIELQLKSERQANTNTAGMRKKLSTLKL